jgi:hypothetical protein
MLSLLVIYALLGALFSALIFFGSDDDEEDSGVYLFHLHLWIALFWPSYAYVLVRSMISDSDEGEG